MFVLSFTCSISGWYYNNYLESEWMHVTQVMYGRETRKLNRQIERRTLKTNLEVCVFLVKDSRHAENVFLANNSPKCVKMLPK